MVQVFHVHDFLSPHLGCYGASFSRTRFSLVPSWLLWCRFFTYTAQHSTAHPATFRWPPSRLVARVAFAVAVLPRTTSRTPPDYKPPPPITQAGQPYSRPPAQPRAIQRTPLWLPLPIRRRAKCGILPAIRLMIGFCKRKQSRPRGLRNAMVHVFTPTPPLGCYGAGSPPTLSVAMVHISKENKKINNKVTMVTNCRGDTTQRITRNTHHRRTHTPHLGAPTHLLALQ